MGQKDVKTGKNQEIYSKNGTVGQLFDTPKLQLHFFFWSGPNHLGEITLCPTPPPFGISIFLKFFFINSFRDSLCLYAGIHHHHHHHRHRHRHRHRNIPPHCRGLMPLAKKLERLRPNSFESISLGPEKELSHCPLTVGGNLKENL